MAVSEKKLECLAADVETRETEMKNLLSLQKGVSAAS
jgi:hypothetical protein